MENQPLTMCKNFTYLGSTVSESASLHQEITLRMGKAIALPTGNFRKDCGETDMLPSGLNVRYIVLLCSVHSSAMQRLGPYTSHSLLLRRFVFSQCRGKRLVMNRKRPWEGYRQQLSPSRLPLRAHFHRERDVWVRDSTSHK